jgi:hypothetical protein
MECAAVISRTTGQPTGESPRKATQESGEDHLLRVRLSFHELSAARRTENSPFRRVPLRETNGRAVGATDRAQPSRKAGKRYFQPLSSNQRNIPGPRQSNHYATSPASLRRSPGDVPRSYGAPFRGGHAPYENAPAGAGADREVLLAATPEADKVDQAKLRPATWRRRRRRAAPTKPKPRIIIAQVAGSGMALWMPPSRT